MKLSIYLKKNDQGAALAMVLILVVVLSLSMSAVMMLTQSSASALKQNAASASRRTALVTDAMAQVINNLSYTSTGATARLGVDEPGFGCPATQYVDAHVGISPTSPTVRLRVYCSQITASGKTASLAGLVLTGDSCTSGCEVGLDGGLYVQTTNGNAARPCGNADDARLTFKSGIINFSGATRKGGCTSLAFYQQGALRQPVVSSCAYSGADITCGCPTNGDSAWYRLDANGIPIEPKSISECTADVAAADWLTTKKSVEGFISTITGGLQIQGAAAAVSTPSDIACTVLVTSGVINEQVVKAIKASASNLSCASRVKKTLLLRGSKTLDTVPGLYTLKDVALTFSDLGVDRIFGGWETGTEVCSTGKAGAQIQITDATSSLDIGGSNKVTLCAPYWDKKYLPAFAVTGTSNTYAITMSNGSSGGLDLQGMMFSPKRPIQFYLNSDRTGALGAGAVVKALRIDSTASPKLSSEVTDPPPSPGDRVVQLIFRPVDAAGVETGEDLGSVQVFIRDYFGKRRAYGFEIRGWRTLW